MTIRRLPPESAARVQSSVELAALITARGIAQESIRETAEQQAAECRFRKRLAWIGLAVVFIFGILPMAAAWLN